jgi:hypothetical protein
MASHKLLLLPFFCLVIHSCQIMHVAPTYHPPCFTDRNQFEGAVNLAPTGLNTGLAYSPLKYLSVQAGGLCNLNSRYFNNQLEGGIGGYLPIRSWLIGANAGYGIGVTDYKNPVVASQSSNYIMYARFDTKKHSWGLYIAHRLPDSVGWIGLSFRKSFYDDFYYATSTLNKGQERYNYSVTQATHELNFFVKTRIRRSEKIYFTLNSGLMMLSKKIDRQLVGYPTLRLGCMIKI